MRILRAFLLLLLAVSFCARALGREGGKGTSHVGPRTLARTPAVRGWELAASDGVDYSDFGYALAISGGTVVVGENCQGKRRCNLQHVYVFEESASGWSNMVQTAELSPSDAQVGNEFGTTGVAISGGTIVVGAENGKAYVFVKPAGGWTDMTETAQLSDGLSGDCFGCSVAIDDNTIVVGAANATISGNQSQGAAYVFVKPSTGWATTEAFAGQLTASDGTFEDLFGISLAVSGKTIVVGAPFYQDRAGPGAAYVFVEPETGWTTTAETAELTESQQGLYDEFGLSVAIDRNVIVVGAQQVVSGPNGDGAVYVFVQPATGWANTTETAELLSSVATQNFGHSVGISGNQVVVGTFSGTDLIFVYTKPKTGWQSTSTPATTLSGGQANNYFGFSVAIAGHAIVAGALDQTVNRHLDQGAAYVFGN